MLHFFYAPIFLRTSSVVTHSMVTFLEINMTSTDCQLDSTFYHFTRYAKCRKMLHFFLIKSTWAHLRTFDSNEMWMNLTWMNQGNLPPMLSRQKILTMNRLFQERFFFQDIRQIHPLNISIYCMVLPGIATKQMNLLSFLLRHLTLIPPTPKVNRLRHQYRARPACTSVQSDQALYCWLTNFKFSS